MTGDAVGAYRTRYRYAQYLLCSFSVTKLSDSENLTCLFESEGTNFHAELSRGEARDDAPNKETRESQPRMRGQRRAHHPSHNHSPKEERLTGH